MSLKDGYSGWKGYTPTFDCNELFLFAHTSCIQQLSLQKGIFDCSTSATSERITQPRGKRAESQEAGESQVLGSAAVISSYFCPSLHISPSSSFHLLSTPLVYLHYFHIPQKAPAWRFIWSSHHRLIISCRSRNEIRSIHLGI